MPRPPPHPPAPGPAPAGPRPGRPAGPTPAGPAAGPVDPAARGRRLRRLAARVTADAEHRRDVWSSPVTRRRLLAGAGAAGASSLVTTRASFAAPAAQAADGTLVVVFLRGGMDGLSALVPGDDPHLAEARPNLGIPTGSLLALDRGFGLHPSLAPFHELWKQGRFTAVPAVSTPDISRSHFQAQDCLERGGATTGTTEGWLDRVLDRLGPGTTFRSVGQGHGMQRSLVGDQPTLSLSKAEQFKLGGWDEGRDRTVAALGALYTGVDLDMAHDVNTTISALATVEQLATGTPLAEGYPDNEFAKGLAELARLIKADTGLRVAAIDMNGWDTHGYQGKVDDGTLKRLFEELSWSLGTFASDLGDRLDRVTVVVMTEFGRRIDENASFGTDHGHGAAVMVLGGKVRGGTVHGNWQGLAPEVRDQGDVPGSNDYRNVLGDVVTGRLGLTAADMAEVFPGHRYQPIGIMA
jgi:uncharacterized protein (DUF1501 family)